MDIQLNKDQLTPLSEDIIEMLLKKNADYGSASFDLGLNGNMVHLWDKVKRYRTLVEKQQCSNAKPNFESIEDTLRDIIGYALIGLTIIKNSSDGESM
ncbi:MAG: DUF1599 domain-containing protein [Sphingobacteriales bacterium]|nr:MAG: DUF1599 domain-containing protein [Sphingobacteriales bacterium]